MCKECAHVNKDIAAPNVNYLTAMDYYPIHLRYVPAMGNVSRQISVNARVDIQDGTVKWPHASDSMHQIHVYAPLMVRVFNLIPVSVRHHILEMIVLYQFALGN